MVGYAIVTTVRNLGANFSGGAMNKWYQLLEPRLVEEDYDRLCNMAGYKFPEYFAKEVILNARLFPWFNNASNKFLSELDYHFVKSEGKILDSIASYFRIVRGPAPTCDETILQIVNQVREKGYCVIDPGFQPETMEQLRAEVANRPMVNSYSNDKKSFADLTTDASSPHNPGNYRTTFTEEPFASNSVLPDLLLHDLVKRVSDCYFGVPSYVIQAVLFVSHPNVKASLDIPEMSQYSQAWHYDLSQLKWLNFFIYLNDVGEGNGAHKCMEKTHAHFIPGKSPSHFLPGTCREVEPGVYFGRFSDAYIDEHYDASSEKTHYGKAGTIIIEDTRCLHRAMPVLTGRRDMLQLNTSISSLSTWRCSSRYEIDCGAENAKIPSSALQKFKTLDSYLSPVLTSLRAIHREFESRYSGENLFQSRMVNMLRRVKAKGKALFSR